MPSNYVLLRKTTLTATATSVTFSNIPQSGYTDLKVVYSAKTNYASNYSDPVLVTINSSTSTFTSRYFSTNGASVYAGTFDRWVGNAANSNVTANIFGNTEVYFPNYLSSNNKSFSFEGASENNGTFTDLAMGSGFWSTASAIHTLQFTPLNGSFLANSEFSLYGIANVGTVPQIAPFATGGDSVTNDGTYWIHTFLSSGTFTPTKSLTCDYLVVAGGGGGASGHIAADCGGGGGGAGGLRTTTSVSGVSGRGASLESRLSLSVQSYAVAVGAGGVGGPGQNNSGNKGSDSAFSTVTSIGGARGQTTGSAGATGGAGGGAGADGRTGGAGTTAQGFDGGGSGVQNQAGGGGGGAGSAGTGGVSNTGGTGGSGLAVAISGSSLTYAAGGNGAGNSANTPAAATSNTGNGGQSGGGSGQGANGGSGIVIIRYPMA